MFIITFIERQKAGSFFFNDMTLCILQTILIIVLSYAYTL